MIAATIENGEVSPREHPDPRPGMGEALVRVRAAGLNGADMAQLRGAYPAPPGWPQDIPGMELAGELEELGPGISRFAVGDRVMAIAGGGAQADDRDPPPRGERLQVAGEVVGADQLEDHVVGTVVDEVIGGVDARAERRDLVAVLSR